MTSPQSIREHLQGQARVVRLASTAGAAGMVAAIGTSTRAPIAVLIVYAVAGIAITLAVTQLLKLRFRCPICRTRLKFDSTGGPSVCPHCNADFGQPMPQGRSA
jgi:hypothetical protein